MVRGRIGRLAALGGMALASASLATAQQLPGAYTAAQAAAGRTAYQQYCASCHLPDLRGSNEAPPLSGVNFLNTWRSRTAADLFNRIRNTMPANNPGTLGEQEATNIVAFLLQSNGAAAGPQALTAASSTLLGDIARGGAPAQAQPATGGPPAGMVV